MKKNLCAPESSNFDRLIIKQVKTSDPFNVSESLVKEISRINNQIIEGKNKLYRLFWLCFDAHINNK